MKVVAIVRVEIESTDLNYPPDVSPAEAVRRSWEELGEGSQFVAQGRASLASVFTPGARGGCGSIPLLRTAEGCDCQ